jgi:serine/threonine-protein kinase
MNQAETADEHPLVGQTIAGKYKIVRLLGEGGMGCVYLGEQQLGTTTRKVAVKTLHKHLSHDPSIKARFQREVGTVAALQHPNTIQVFDFGMMEEGTLYIVMEFVQGRSVADVLEKDGPMPPERVEHILRQVVGSLEEAHSHGIVHRDLKPDNVVLSERVGQKDWVKVLDFGIAKRSSEHDPNEAKLTQQGMVLGTPPYMSPEQFTGQPVDVRSDIYALGVMAYEMLTGRLPWVANTAWEWASKHMTEPPTPLEHQPFGPNVPGHMRAAIVRALAKKKEERFASVREFFDAFSGGAAHVSVHGAPMSMQSSPGPSGGTAVINAQPMAGDPAALGGSSRVKTELGAPVIPPVDAPPFGAAGVPPTAVPAAVPAAPATTTTGKKGPPVLVIGLGALAVLLIGGAVIAGLASSSKRESVPTTTNLDLGGSASATAAASSLAHVDPPPPDIPTVAPTLDTSNTNIPSTPATANNNSSTSASGGASKTKPTPTPTPTPTPVPTPQPKTDPTECVRYRAEKAAGRTGAVLKALETACKKAGGTP